MLAQWFGASGGYLCTRNKNKEAMRNTNYNLDNLTSVISSESSLQTLMDMIGDLGLEILDIHTA